MRIHTTDWTNVIERHRVPPFSPAVAVAGLITLGELVLGRASWLGDPPWQVLAASVAFFVALWLIAALVMRLAGSFGLLALWLLSILWLAIHIGTGTWPWTLSPRTGLYLLESFWLWSRLAFPLLLVAFVYGQISLSRRGLIAAAAVATTWLGLWVFARRFAYAHDVGMILEPWTVAAGAVAWLTAIVWPLIVGAVLASTSFRLSAAHDAERVAA